MDTKEPLKLSILVPTIGRKKEVGELLQSIVDCFFDFSYEIIIIDQNGSNLLDEIISVFQHQLPINHHKVEFRGLSKAKNYGAKIASGAFISFPDDDCLIFKDTYSKAFEEINTHNLDLVFGKCIDKEGKDSVLNFNNEAYFLNKNNMIGGFVEATVVCKKEVFDDFQFDENMGAGTFFGAEEGFDWVYRLLTTSKHKIYYTPKIKFYHPQVILDKGDLTSLNRVFKYRCGTAYLCVKHGFNFTYYKRLILTKIATFLFLLKNKNVAEYYRVEAMALQIGKIFAKKLNHVQK
ncbi:glycosyltransferase family 2 protein [Elizabethkingia occulta]|uniref:Glycosyltransferase 2-like domain-containing protein n=2 Tax=Elizabethkingia occulta TaxID=1867263 RepID=A0A1T3MA54_9FLAO|nr:glycosyltransferase [Elizabethkingia occulta]OPB92350.1 hypothetical protein BB020_09650 [Elizabethkingia occulta]OPC61548.1 hypothetical protein BAZ10_10600 [Elizabethkingia occulta]